MRKPPPILLIAWRRPDKLRETIAAVRAARPERVYVACDGPDPSRIGEIEAVLESRRTIDREIDWDCRLQKLYSDTNLGCRRGVSTAISWFFEQETEGIILEDDCVAHRDFFPFCSALLERYRSEENVWCITGDNFQNGQTRGDGSYYFSKYPHCWGWATWKRAWNHYCPSLNYWPEWKKTRQWRRLAGNFRERFHWEQVLDQVYLEQLDSWASVWLACVWKGGGLTATPSVNLVTNIGFGNAATHTKTLDVRSDMATGSLHFPLMHPPSLIPDHEADKYVFETVFKGGGFHARSLRHRATVWWRALLRAAGALLKKLLPLQQSNVDKR